MLTIKTFSLALMASLMLSSAAVADDIVLLISRNADGSSYVEYSVPLERAKKIPHWQPLSDEEPPVSLGKAINIASRKAKAENPKVVGWKLQSVEMREAHEHNIDNPKGFDVWFYYIELIAPGDSPDAEVLVLMDGSMARSRLVKNKPAKHSR